MNNKFVGLVLCLSFFVFSHSADAFFVDVREDHQHYEAIERLYDEGVVREYRLTFEPEKPVNRAEFLKMAIAARGDLDLNSYEFDDDATLENCFPDVTVSWYARYVCYAKREGWVHGGGDGMFHPERPVSLVEVAKIIFNVLDPASYEIDVVNDQLQAGVAWYRPYVKHLSDNYEIPPTVVELDQGLTRAEVAEMIWREKFMVNSYQLKGNQFRWEGEELFVDDYLGGFYSRRGEDIYYNDDLMEGVYEPSFQLVELNNYHFAKDNNNVYLEGEVLQLADVTTFKADGSYFWGKDGQVYLVNGYTGVPELVEEADPDTFRLYNDVNSSYSHFAVDANYVYDQLGEVVEGSHGPSFEILDEEINHVSGAMVRYAKDDNQVYTVFYWEGAHLSAVEGADSSSFELIGDHLWRDKDDLYLWNEVVDLEVDLENLEFFGRTENENGDYYAVYFGDGEKIYEYVHWLGGLSDLKENIWVEDVSTFKIAGPDHVSFDDGGMCYFEGDFMSCLSGM